jgi:hypothetical protein
MLRKIGCICLSLLVVLIFTSCGDDDTAAADEKAAEINGYAFMAVSQAIGEAYAQKSETSPARGSSSDQNFTLNYSLGGVTVTGSGSYNAINDTYQYTADIRFNGYTYAGYQFTGEVHCSVVSTDVNSGSYTYSGNFTATGLGQSYSIGWSFVVSWSDTIFSYSGTYSYGGKPFSFSYGGTI